MAGNRKFLMQSSLGLAIALMYLASCGSEDRKFDNPHDPNSEGGSSTNSTDDNGGTTSTTTTTTNDGETASDGNTPASKALSYSNYTELSGVTAIHSATRVGELFYITGRTATGTFLATLDDDGNLSITQLSAISSAAVTLAHSSAHYLPSGLSNSDDLYLLDGTSYDRYVIQIDKALLKATARISLGCSDYGNSTISDPYNLYKLSSRWNYFSNGVGNYNMVCGMTDGSKLEQKAITFTSSDIDSSYTAGQFHFDGASFWIYYRGNSTNKGWLNKFSASFEFQERYSTNGYLYGGSSSLFVSDQSNYWFFGCKDSKCYKTDVTVVDQ